MSIKNIKKCKRDSDLPIQNIYSIEHQEVLDLANIQSVKINKMKLIVLRVTEKNLKKKDQLVLQKVKGL